MKTNRMLLVFSVLAVLTSTANASPLVVYNNLGPGQSYGNGLGEFSPGQGAAVPFTPTSNVTFDAVLLPILVFANSDLVSLVPDAGGHPGATPLESFTVTAPLNGMVQLNSVLDPELTAGKTYWITDLAPSGEAGWYVNSTGVSTFAGTGNGGVTWIPNLSTTPAMEVLGNPLATPEPASLTLLGTGVLAFGGLGVRRWRRKASTT